MENASKALIMAGGILIALIIIGLLLVMINQLGGYEKSEDSSTKDSQLAEFNLDFERYTDDKGIKGTDIISLINKVINYNKKANSGGVKNSVNYDIKMSIEITNLDPFKAKYPVADGTTSLFSSKLVIDETNTNKDFKEIMADYAYYEEQYSLSVMSKLASAYKTIKDETNGISESSAKYKKIIEKYTGKNIQNPPSLALISRYKQYSEFKSSIFEVSRSPTYENGQIKGLYFKFKK